ncbi:MAG: peptidase M24 [Acidobacteria bacterium]|nr:MAG: peptidase M24 [Acidobacteriota bacterium]
MSFRRLRKLRSALRPSGSGAMPKALRPRRAIRPIAVFALVLTTLSAPLALLLDAREREPNGVYAERRAHLVAQLSAPVLLFGYTGRENSSPSYVFLQEPNFYYLTGHNEEGAALLLVPSGTAEKSWKGANEILFLPPRKSEEEKWNGPRMGPTDADVQKKTGFAAIEAFSNLKSHLTDLAQSYHEIWTLAPHAEDTGYPHAREWSAWITQAAPGIAVRDAAAAIGAMRQIKTPGEIALLTKAIELSMDAQLAATRMVRPGLYEYQVAARMVEIHAYGGCETEAYAPIVGTGLHSTILHFNQLDALIQDGDVVLIDVGGQYSGYTADITRTLPANGHFTGRQREIYDIVLGAQNAVLAAMKPGATLGRQGSNSLFKVAYDYINTHGADRDGRSLGRYFTHGLGHHIGLEVHDAGDPSRPLEPGMVVTAEPGVYIPEERIGVRIEDDVLITPTGYKLLTARLPRSVDEIEKIMAEAKVARDERSSER